MRLLKFPEEFYSENIDDGSFSYRKLEESKIGKLELIWTYLEKCGLQGLTAADHKTIRRLKRKVREVTRFKDKDEDSRISKEGSQSLYLEEEEYSMLKRIVDDMITKTTSYLSDDIDDLLSIITSAEDYKIKQPT